MDNPSEHPERPSSTELNRRDSIDNPSEHTELEPYLSSDLSSLGPENDHQSSHAPNPQKRGGSKQRSGRKQTSDGSEVPSQKIKRAGKCGDKDKQRKVKKNVEKPATTEALCGVIGTEIGSEKDQGPTEAPSSQKVAPRRIPAQRIPSQRIPSQRIPSRRIAGRDKQRAIEETPSQKPSTSKSGHREQTEPILKHTEITGTVSILSTLEDGDENTQFAINETTHTKVPTEPIISSQPPASSEPPPSSKRKRRQSAYDEKTSSNKQAQHSRAQRNVVTGGGLRKVQAGHREHKQVPVNSDYLISPTGLLSADQTLSLPPLISFEPDDHLMEVDKEVAQSMQRWPPLLKFVQQSRAPLTRIDKKNNMPLASENTRLDPFIEREIRTIEELFLKEGRDSTIDMSVMEVMEFLHSSIVLINKIHKETQDAVRGPPLEDVPQPLEEAAFLEKLITSGLLRRSRATVSCSHNKPLPQLDISLANSDDPGSCTKKMLGLPRSPAITTPALSCSHDSPRILPVNQLSPPKSHNGDKPSTLCPSKSDSTNPHPLGPFSPAFASRKRRYSQSAVPVQNCEGSRKKAKIQNNNRAKSEPLL
ncbi:hypothetical protein, variant [Puccinia triticina 1-1 BBBD Race 1]|uniref:Uncharacterized protein n=2 Tax=Puccinia triticina TaxID=208348 RepID=A0A180G556_PUCT1|nr:uncharacterized protein PtA15_13A307 [Puccinia triticina]OAV87776.1 hypothetical protein, variant [Puccinia triticina 1-1 BBBD Race 1]WAQ90907.1 hypothetical protein PtA15_13A307 [Puccinia triticina]